MIYLIKSNGYYKIGYTSNNNAFSRRMGAYKTHNPKFELIGVIPGDAKDEKRFHKKYKSYKLKDRTEWFDFKYNLDEVENLFKNKKVEMDIYNIFGLKVMEIDKYESDEVYTQVDFIINHSKYQLVLASDGILYVIFTSFEDNFNTFKVFRVELDLKDLSVFYYDYDEYGEQYTGIIYKDIIYSAYRIRWQPLPLSGFISHKSIKGFYDKIKHTSEKVIPVI